MTKVLFKNLVLSYDPSIPFARIFDDALLGFILYPDKTEAFGVAVRPLEIVQQRPDEVAAHIHAILHGQAGLDEVVFR